MRVAAIIPARAGSKRLPGKNLQLLAGKTLVAHAVDAAHDAGIDAWVSTEDDLIARHAASLGAMVRARPLALAGDTVSTERVIEDWWRHLSLDERYDCIVLLQPSTPLLKDAGKHVAGCVELLVHTGADSVVAVTRDPHVHFAGRCYPRDGGFFDWRPFRPFSKRPRTQNLGALAVEHGAIYAFTAAHWLRTHLRDGGRCRAYLLPKWTSVDIDDAADLEAARLLCGGQ